MHPNFFILGAQKAGTTYLAKVLSEHRDVYFAEPKELLFFQKAGLTSADFEAYIKQYFSGASGQRWVGEGSTVYLQWPKALENLQRFVSGTPRFIVCLRQPTDRAVSFFIHNWRRDRYPPGTSLLQAADMRLALSPWETGCYASSIKRWFAAYPREQFCFIDFDELRRNKVEFAKAATDFLGISPPVTTLDSVVNAGLPLVWENDALTTAPRAGDDRPRPVFHLDELEKLNRRFQADIAETETLTGLDLSAWRDFPTFATA
jgi:hypothetical protein